MGEHALSIQDANTTENPVMMSVNPDPVAVGVAERKGKVKTKEGAAGSASWKKKRVSKTLAKAEAANIAAIVTATATATPSAPVAITINDGLLGMGMLKSGHPLYGLKFSYFTGKGTAEQQAAGRLVKGMVLTDVSCKEIKGMGYEETKKHMSHRPITLTFQQLEAANIAAAADPAATILI
jgi:hypothetical protein